MDRNTSILILPYNTQDGILSTLLLKSIPGEYGEKYTLMREEYDGESDHYSKAVKLVQDQGYNVEDPDRWHFLGARTFGAEPFFCYSVDITNVTKNEILSLEGTGESRIESVYSEKTVKDLLNEGDGLACGLFVQLFKYAFNYKDYSIIKIQK